MFGLIVHFKIFSLVFANSNIEHDAKIDIVHLQDELRRQGDLIDILLKRLDEQENRINEQDKIIAQQAEQIVILENRDNFPDENLSTRKYNNTQQDNNKRKASMNKEFQHKRLASRPQIRAFQEGPVAFHATVNAANDVTHISLGEKIVFNKVKFTLGGGYHGQHGLFIAPKAGIYIFSVSILSSHNTIIEAALEKNGVTLAGAYSKSDDGFDQGSVTVVTQLSIGDEVYVVNTWPNVTSFHTHEYTSFTGYLLTEIKVV
ncbi:hypothetical protein ACF0H5_015355 [Mactra antiquata]